MSWDSGGWNDPDTGHELWLTCKAGYVDIIISDPETWQPISVMLNNRDALITFRDTVVDMVDLICISGESVPS